VVAFIISLAIKRHSMDKILASRFVLKGARASTLAALAAVETGSTANDAFLAARLPQLVVNFPSQPAAAVCPCPRNKEEGPDGGVPCGREKANPSGSNQEREQTESPSTERSETPKVEVAVAAVAYYVEPGGRRVPFDIVSTPAAFPGPSGHNDQPDEDEEHEAVVEKVDEGESISGSTTSMSATDDSSLSEQTSDSSAEDDISESSVEEVEQDTQLTTETQSCNCSHEEEEQEEEAQSPPDEVTLQMLSEYATWESLFNEGDEVEAEPIPEEVEEETDARTDSP